MTAVPRPGGEDCGPHPHLPVLTGRSHGWASPQAAEERPWGFLQISTEGPAKGSLTRRAQCACQGPQASAPPEVATVRLPLLEFTCI